MVFIFCGKRYSVEVTLSSALTVDRIIVINEPCSATSRWYSTNIFECHWLMLIFAPVDTPYNKVGGLDVKMYAAEIFLLCDRHVSLGYKKRVCSKLLIHDHATMGLGKVRGVRNGQRSVGDSQLCVVLEKQLVLP
jgi:hypothetical protein